MKRFKVLNKDTLQNIRALREAGINRVEKITNERHKDITYPNQGEKFNIGGFFINILADDYQKGNIMLEEHGFVVRYGSISNDTTKTYFYRGENKIFKGTVTSSLGRKLRTYSDSYQVTLEIILQHLKITVFENLLNETGVTDEWNFGIIYPHIISQHYGLKTQYLDLTDDIDVALFFACTKYIDGEYFPIMNKDISEYGRYGSLYIGEQSNFNIQKGNLNRIKMIGYQPFTRCSRQRGYYVDTNETIGITSYNLTDYYNFERYLFERDEKLTTEVFNKFDGGRYLFPETGKSLTKLFDKIDKLKHFSIKELTNTLQKINNDYPIEMIKEGLRKKGITIKNEIKRKYFEMQIKEINFDVEKYITEEGVLLGTRLVGYGSSD